MHMVEQAVGGGGAQLRRPTSHVYDATLPTTIDIGLRITVAIGNMVLGYHVVQTKGPNRLIPSG